MYDREMATRRKEIDAQLAEAAALRANFDQRVHEAQLGVATEVQGLRDRLATEQAQKLQLEANLSTARSSMDPGFDHIGKLEEETRHRLELDALLVAEREKTSTANAHIDALRVETELLRSELNARPHEVVVQAPVMAPVVSLEYPESSGPLVERTR